MPAAASSPAPARSSAADRCTQAPLCVYVPATSGAACLYVPSVSPAHPNSHAALKPLLHHSPVRCWRGCTSEASSHELLPSRGRLHTKQQATSKLCLMHCLHCLIDWQLLGTRTVRNTSCLRPPHCFTQQPLHLLLLLLLTVAVPMVCTPASQGHPTITITSSSSAPRRDPRPRQRLTHRRT